MDGDIECRSQPNQGTLFDFYVNATCKFNDKGVSDKEHLKFQNLVNAIKQKSKSLIKNLYEQADNNTYSENFESN